MSSVLKSPHLQTNTHFTGVGLPGCYDHAVVWGTFRTELFLAGISEAEIGLFVVSVGGVCLFIHFFH